MADHVDRIVETWASRRADLDLSPMHVVGRIQRLSALWDTYLRAPFAAAGLCAGDFDVLAALRRLGEPTTPGDLSTALLVTAGATTKRVDRLISRGLASRSVAPGDGRSRLVELTAEGIALADSLIATHVHNEMTLVSCLNAEERDTLRTLLQRLLEHTEEITRPGASADDEKGFSSNDQEAHPSTMAASPRAAGKRR